MLVDAEIRERLSHFCTVSKLTQEKAANLALREMLERCEQDPRQNGPREGTQGRVGKPMKKGSAAFRAGQE
jgi:hypothetical protein